MGRNRKKAGAGAIDAKIYDIFGNVIGETGEPAPAAQTPAPTPEPKPAPAKKPASRKKKPEPEIVGSAATGDIAKSRSIISNSPIGEQMISRAQQVYAQPTVKIDRKAKRERAVLIDDVGNILGEFQGTASRVRMPAVTMLRSSHITHNHPDVVTFSPADLINMGETGLLSIEAQAIPMKKEERQQMEAMLDLIMDDLDIFIPESVRYMRPEIEASFRDMRDLFKNNPGAMNLTFVAALNKLTKGEAMRERNTTRATMLTITTRAQTLFNNMFRTPNYAKEWHMASTVILTKVLGKPPVRTNPYLNQPELDTAAISKSMNFLANAIMQHVLLQASWRKENPSSVSYSVTLS